MKKISFLALISILSLGVSSCSYIKEFSEKRQELDDAPNVSINVNAEGEEQAEETEQEQDPLAEAIETTESLTREQDIVGLIVPTNPEARVSSSVRGRQDPFSTVAVKPQIEVDEEVPTAQPARTRDRRSSRSSERVRRPRDLGSAPTIEAIEEAVSPTANADNVLITGLIELGDRIKVIIQAPDEATSRYVDIGQYISNGKVLVKRIESSFPTPTVILEESGREVARTVGQPTEEDAGDQAVLPPPPPTSGSVSWLSNYLSQVNLED